MEHGLPQALAVNGREYAIRTSYRCALDALEVLADPGLPQEEKALEVLAILYPGFDAMPRRDYRDAVQQALRYLNGGREDDGPPAPRLLDWGQDFDLIVGPVNRVLGFEVRGTDIHWYTFLSAFYEIGDCAFAQVVNIRNKLLTGRKLAPQEKEYYRRNRGLVDLKRRYSGAEKALIARLT